DLERVANTASGLLGISGLSSDLRVLEQAWHEGHARARLAIKTFVHRIARHIAGHAAALQRLDGIIFTGGIGVVMQRGQGRYLANVIDNLLANNDRLGEQ
ncbi:hypothetical protein OQ620_29390, partial [Klebsiella pneumoniae]|nr:hypothetical protein [Klebsiella pneumoniae]